LDQKKQHNYYCLRAYTPDCNGNKCSIWGTPRCEDGMLTVQISDKDHSNKMESCPRAYTPDCNGDKCSIWGTPSCVDGNVYIKFM